MTPDELKYLSKIYGLATAFFGVALLLFYAFLVVTQGLPEYHRGLKIDSDAAWINVGEWVGATQHFAISFAGLIAGGVYWMVHAFKRNVPPTVLALLAWASVGAFAAVLLGGAICGIAGADWTRPSGKAWYLLISAGMGFAAVDGFRRASVAALAQFGELSHPPRPSSGNGS